MIYPKIHPVSNVSVQFAIPKQSTGPIQLIMKCGAKAQEAHNAKD
jgi:hypothetical protein